MQPAFTDLRMRNGAARLMAQREALALPATSLLHSLALAAFLYLALAIGKFAAPSLIGGQPSYLHTVGFAAAFLLLFIRPATLAVLARTVGLLFPFLVVLAVSAFFTEDWAYAQKKLDSAFLVTPLISVAAAELVARNGIARALKLFLLVALAFLAMTILYKLQSGLFDRQSRFFLNGPIVFGWLMGLNCLLSLHLYLSERRAAHWLAAAAAFALAVLWTASKGPLLALGLALVFLLASRMSRRSVMALTVLPAAAYFLAPRLLPETALERLAALDRLFSGQTTGADAGSIGARTDAFGDAIATFVERPLFGVGLGNFQFSSGTGLLYPHSIVPESLAEMGLAGAVALIFTGTRILISTSALGRLVLVYFAVALSFSGDLSYIHLLLGLPIALILARKPAAAQDRA